MADDIYEILNILSDIRELLEREQSQANYSQPINNQYVRTVMDSPLVHNVMKTDKKTGEKVDTGVLDFKSLEKSVNSLLTQLRLNNTETRAYIKTAISQVEKDYDKLDKDKQTPYVERSIDALFKEMVRLSSELSDSPLLNIDNKKAKNDPQTQAYLKFYNQQLRHAQETNNILNKLFDFMGKDKSERKGRTRQFIDDLADGLGKSKFIGGAFVDLIRLATFFAANWLKQFGPIGKALAVTLVALGPIIGTKIAGILVKAMSSIIVNTFKWGFSSLGAMLKTVFLSLTNRGAATSFVGGKMGLARAGAALGLGVVSYGLGKTAVDTWKEGGARNKTAAVGLGVGSAGFGVGAIAMLLAPLIPALAPIAPIAIAVGAIAAGIGLIVKFWPQISDFFKMVGEKLGIIAKREELSSGDFVEKPGAVDKVVSTITGQNTVTAMELTGGKYKSLTDKHLDAKKFSETDLLRADTLKPKYGKYGQIINIGQMTQRRASEVIEQDIKAKGSKSYYELIPAKYVEMSQIRTEAKASDNSGIYAPRGSTELHRSKMEALSRAGYDTSNTKITSGAVATIGAWNEQTGEFIVAPHAYTPSLSGHFGGGVTLDYTTIRKAGTGERISSSELKKITGAYSVTGKGAKGHETHEHVAYGVIVPKEEESIKKEELPYLVESVKESIRIRESELQTYKEKAAEDSVISKREAAEIKSREDEIQHYNARLNQLQEVSKSVEKNPKLDLTGNTVVSSILKDAVILQQFQKSQQ